jgi:predicted nucleic acid-binding protein
VILYLDASAIVKRYFKESRSTEVASLISGAEVVGTAVISRAEVVSAFAKAVRTKLVSSDSALAALTAFNGDWEYLLRLQLSEGLAARAALLACEHGAVLA